MKTDTIFYHLFHSFPSIFFELIGRDGTEAKHYDFTSVEIKELAFRLDGVFLPQPGITDSPIYFAEVQFQKDERLVARLCAEIFVYLYQHRPEADWRAVVIYPRRSLDTGVPEHYRELFTSGRITRLYLDQMAEAETRSVGVAVARLVTEKVDEVAAAARQLVTRAKEEIYDLQTRAGLIDLIETIMIYKLPALSRKEIEAMLGLSELRQTRVYQEAWEEGRADAVREGLLEGIELGLEIKFGGEGLTILPEIRKIEDVDILRAIREGLKIVNTLPELRQIYRGS